MNTIATPFEECPTEAFLSQKIDGYINYRGVNLATGEVNTLRSNENNGLGSDTVNGIAFNKTDRYIYGFNMTDFKLIRFDSDFNPQELSFSGNIPTNFFVADIKDNKYYVYKKNYGFFSINLDNEANDYLSFKSFANSEKSIAIADFAFHPRNEKLYAVDKAGLLYEINHENGQFTLLGNTGSGSGTFGAAYFDINGGFYFVNNKNGNIYKINMGDNTGSGIDPTAVLFSKASPTTSNDGARCPTAPLPPVTQDYGDAPDTYLTTGDSGARHTVNQNNYFLGDLIDIDSNGAPYPDSDNNNGISDEDGVEFVSAIMEDSNVKTKIKLGGGANAYISAWLDLNADGDFADSGEKILISQILYPGINEINFNIPNNVTTNVNTWIRFRLHKDYDAEVSYSGAMGYGEVEDYMVEIQESQFTKTYYPSKTTFATIAFEDKWPYKGDYDFNDVVVDFRITEFYSSTKLKRIEIEGEIESYGADYFNGFAFELSSSSLDFNESIIESYLFYLNGDPNDNVVNLDETFDFSLGNNEKNKVILKIMPEIKEKAWSRKNAISVNNCEFKYFRTNASCSSHLEPIPFKAILTIKDSEGPTMENAPKAPYKPYIYLTKRTGISIFDNILSGSKDREVHLKNNEVTFMGDTTLFGTESDRSDFSNLFLDESNMPWAILVTDGFYPPTAGTNITEAYPEFADFINSNGSTNKNWNQNFVPGKVITE
jgi:LruC domain-containing protein